MKTFIAIILGAAMLLSTQFAFAADLADGSDQDREKAGYREGEYRSYGWQDREYPGGRNAPESGGDAGGGSAGGGGGDAGGSSAGDSGCSR